MRLKPEEISRVIREQIKNYEAKVSEADTGTVLILSLIHISEPTRH